VLRLRLNDVLQVLAQHNLQLMNGRFPSVATREQTLKMMLD